MNEEELQRIIHDAVVAGIFLGMDAVGETRSLGGKTTFTETHLKAEDAKALIDSTVSKLKEIL